MKVAVIVNPVTVDQPDALRAAIQEALPDADVDWRETTEEDTGRGPTEQALGAGAELVLVGGGDGTVTACASAMADSGVPLGLLPTGTGNLLVRNLGLETDVAAALAVIARGNTRGIDLVETSRGASTVIAGLGVDAAMIRDTGDTAKARMGWLAYVGGALKALRRPPTAHYRITVDDDPVVTVRAVGVLVGNVGELQGGMAVLPDARPDDGLVDVIALMPRGFGQIVALAVRLLRRSADASPSTRTWRGQRVTIRADRAVPGQLDGEYLGEFRDLDARVRPAALIVCTP